MKNLQKIIFFAMCLALVAQAMRKNQRRRRGAYFTRLNPHSPAACRRYSNTPSNTGKSSNHKYNNLQKHQNKRRNTSTTGCRDTCSTLSKILIPAAILACIAGAVVRPLLGGAPATAANSKAINSNHNNIHYHTDLSDINNVMECGGKLFNMDTGVSKAYQPTGRLCHLTVAGEGNTTPKCEQDLGEFKIGDRIEVNYRDKGIWYPATIRGEEKPRYYRVTYDDSIEPNQLFRVKKRNVRRPKLPVPHRYGR